jgi:ketosteroid isomerase-like protein
VIEQTVRRWQAFLDAGFDSGLANLLADDVVFHSPVVHSPQRGKSVVSGYLSAAKQLLAGGSGRAFRYTSELFGADLAVLEFETTIGNTYVNGIDVIRTDEAG